MDDKLFKETEAILYKYYQSKLDKKRLEKDILVTEKLLKDIEQDIKSVNVNIDYYQSGMQLSERVQTSSDGTSYAENEICRAIGRLEAEHKKVFKSLLSKRYKLRRYTELISSMEDKLKRLSEEDNRFLELKYGDKKNILQISMIMSMAQATAYRKRENLIKKVAEIL